MFRIHKGQTTDTCLRFFRRRFKQATLMVLFNGYGFTWVIGYDETGPYKPKPRLAVTLTPDQFALIVMYQKAPSTKLLTANNGEVGVLLTLIGAPLYKPFLFKNLPFNILISEVNP